MYVYIFNASPCSLPSYSDDTASFSVASGGLNTAINGNPLLPGETDTVMECHNSVSVFTVDWDAPSNVAAHIQAHLSALVNERHPSPGR